MNGARGAARNERGADMATLAEQKAETAAALETLHTRIEEIHSSAEWQEWLTFLSKLHGYSPLNSMWMWFQWEQRRQVQAVWNVATAGRIAPLPEFSHAAGFKAWDDKHGRKVRKGEKALTVLAPVTVKDRETDRLKVVGFVLKSRTFEVSQTEGDAIPTNPIRCDRLQGEGDPVVFAALAALVKLNGWTLFGTLPGYPSEVNGLCNFTTKTLHVRDTLSEAQQLKTLVHEIAHMLLHTPEEYGQAHGLDRSMKEVEAESVAYVVASALGLDTAAYSVGYVATWGRGKDIATTAQRVLDTAERILTGLETGAIPAAKLPKQDDQSEQVAA